MSRKDDMPQRKKGISILNWMGTLVLCAVPGVNILVLALMAGLAKSRSKRTFAGAALILIGIIAALIIAAFMLFGDQLVAFSQKLVQPQ